MSLKQKLAIAFSFHVSGILDQHLVLTSKVTSAHNFTTNLNIKKSQEETAYIIYFLKKMVEEKSCSSVQKSIKRTCKTLSLLTSIQNLHYIAQSEPNTN